ncbi:MAG: NAD(P)-dependent oxidoreductase, partial [Leeuwenhoekiella sp.]
MKIAFIGLGIMGSRMADNLLKGGHEITVYNRTKEKADKLLSDGALWAETPAGAVNDADVLITMLEKPGVVEEVALGENGFLNAMREDAIWIDSSTVNPSFSEKMAAKAKELKINFLDAPVSGSKVPAAKAELIFLVGGEPEILEEVQPLLDLMGKKTLHIGPAGKGAAMKLMINQMLGQCVLAFS